MVSFSCQSTEIPVSLQKASRKASCREGAASSSAKTGAAITRLPRRSAASRAERAKVFSVSSSFQSAIRMLLSIAVVIAHADGGSIAQRPSCREGCLGSRCHGIFRKDYSFALAGRELRCRPARRSIYRRGELQAHGGVRVEP